METKSSATTYRIHNTCHKQATISFLIHPLEVKETPLVDVNNCKVNDMEHPMASYQYTTSPHCCIR